MTTYTDIFMRDSLSDTGTIPSPSAQPYYSPDIIPYAQVSDPAATFGGANYANNMSANIEYGQYNYVYARCKNLGSATSSCQIKLYWSETSLVMFPSTWRNQGLVQADGTAYVAVNNLAAGAVGVTPEPFVWTPPSDKTYGFCMIGQVITAANPNPIPTTQMTWGSFVTWVRDNPNICWRNLHTENNYADPQYDRLHLVSNETPDPTNMTFTTTLTNFPVGTTIRQLCSSLNIDDQVVTTSTVNYLYSGNPNVAPGYSGSFQVMVILPSGATWPSNGKVQTKSYVGIDSENDVHGILKYADAPEDHFVEMEMLSLPQSGRLVEIGNNTTNFTVTTS